MEVNQSLLLGAMLAEGLAGGSNPVAPAEADRVPEARTPSDAATIQVAVRERRWVVVLFAA
jgi:hypothetical protein